VIETTHFRVPLAVLLGVGGSRSTSQPVAAALQPADQGNPYETWTDKRTSPVSWRELGFSGERKSVEERDQRE
jgi:hypothetical protein